MFDNLLRFHQDKIIVFFDFETECLALNLSLNLVWQYGMLKTQGDNIIDKSSGFIKWDRPLNVSKGAAEVTHFDASKVAQQAKDYREVLPLIIKWTKEADYCGGQNTLCFDSYLLYNMYELMGGNPAGIVEKMIDTHCLAKGMKLGIPFDPQKQSLLEYQYQMSNIYAKGIKTRLEVLGKEYGIDFDPTTLHDAENDITLNFKVWKKLKYQVEI